MLKFPYLAYLEALELVSIVYFVLFLVRLFFFCLGVEW